ncbi:MAG: tRNA-binding protein [Bacteroidetes bacterium]|nr:tRNA-binding protein [Bacteroidota bacterium]
MIQAEDFYKLQLQTGTIIEVKAFPRAHIPAFQLLIDFGKDGIKKSSARITEKYTMEQLLFKKIIAVTNLPVKQIGNFFSECLVLGAPSASGEINLLTVCNEIKDGAFVN